MRGFSKVGLMAAPRFLRRIAWFIAIWLASVAALAIIAYGLRLMIP